MAATTTCLTSAPPPHSNDINNNASINQSKKSLDLVAPQPQQLVDVSRTHDSFETTNDSVNQDTYKQSTTTPSYNFDPCLNCNRYGIIQGQMLLDAHNNTFCGPNCGWSYLLGPLERDRAITQAAMARYKTQRYRPQQRSRNRTNRRHGHSTETGTDSNVKSKSDTKHRRSKTQQATATELSDDWVDQSMMNSMFEAHLNMFNDQ